jgi:cytochrome d ubiquinol oxidase subunit II
MHLYALPLVFALVGLALYTVLGGADFGAGIWQLLAGRGTRAERVRSHAHHSMAPVWEANHVWLIFVLTVTWTAYPLAFGSIASTLEVPLFVAGIGIVFRGAAYALRSGASSGRELRVIDTAFSLSSIITPFALGAALGGIASQRVPVGNAAGHLVSSWLNPTSALIGAIAVVTGAYLAATYLAADAVRSGDRELEDAFHRRALFAGVGAGAVSLAGVIVLHSDAHRVYARLVDGPGLPALIVSILAGLATLALVWRRRFELARLGSALAVAAIVAGWGLAQQPVLLRGLTIRRAAAPHDTLVAVTVAVLGGAVILFPSLAVLFRLTLRGELDHSDEAARAAVPAVRRSGGSSRQLAGRVALACVIGGVGLLTFADASWAHAVGVVLLFAFTLACFAAIAPAALAAQEERGAGDPRR